jgi:hypothetical protein
MAKMIGSYDSGTETIMVPVAVDAGGNLSITPAPGAVSDVRVMDGDGALRTDVALSAPSFPEMYSMATLGLGYIWDGLLWVKQTGESDGSINVNVKGISTETLGASGASGQVDENLTDIFQTYIQNLPNFTVWIDNTGGGSGDALLNVDIDVSHDGIHWVNIDAYRNAAVELLADTLLAGASGIAFQATGHSWGYLRVRAQCAPGEDTTVECAVTCNVV